MSVRRTAHSARIFHGLWDLKTARNLGLQFLGIGFGKKAEQLREAGATVHKDFSPDLALLG